MNHALGSPMPSRTLIFLIKLRFIHPVLDVKLEFTRSVTTVLPRITNSVSRVAKNIDND